MRIAILVLITAFASVVSFGQSCPGSDLTYFVRDAKGKLMSASSTQIKFVDANEPTTYSLAPKWKIGRTSGYHVSESLKTEVKELDAFTVSQMCSFRAPLVLKLTLKGKTMELRFHAPNSGMQSADYVVDSPPFKEGKYEIDLEVQPAPNGVQRFGGFFAASLWKKQP
jgi:hypothetical protein